MQLTIDDLIANKHIQRELEALLYISRKPASRLTAKIDIEIIFLSTTTTARKAEKIHIKDQFNFAGCYSVKTANQDRIETAQQINFQPRVAAVGAGGNRVRMTNVLPRKSCIKNVLLS